MAEGDDATPIRDCGDGEYLATLPLPPPPPSAERVLLGAEERVPVVPGPTRAVCAATGTPVAAGPKNVVELPSVLAAFDVRSVGTPDGVEGAPEGSGLTPAPAM